MNSQEMLKTTPGPWKIDTSSHMDSIVIYADGFLIAQIPANQGEHDARLIATAPDLLEACKAGMHQLWLRRRTFSDQDHNAMNLLSNAIKEAEKKGGEETWTVK